MSLNTHKSNTMDNLDREQNEMQIVKLIDQVEGFVTNQIPFDKGAIIKSVPGNHATADKFFGLYDYYEEPRYDTASFMTMFRACENEKMAINNERRRNARLNNIPIEELDLFRDESKEKEKIIENNGKYLGLNPYGGGVGHTIPIVWKKEVSLDSFAKLVTFYGDTKNIKQLALPASLEAIVRKAEAKGYAKRQLAELLIYFARDYIPELNAIVSEKYQQKKWREVYGAIVRRIDVKEEKNKIFYSLKKVTRHVGDNIVTVTSLLENLCRQSLEITQPCSTEEERTRACEEFIMRYIKVFINQECYRLYERFQEKAIGLYSINLQRCVEEIQAIENRGPRFRIQESRRLPSNMSLMDIMTKGDPGTTTEVNNIAPEKVERKSRRDTRPRNRNQQRSRTPSRSSNQSSTSRNSSRGSVGPRSRQASVNNLNDTKTTYPGKDSNQKRDNTKKSDPRNRSQSKERNTYERNRSGSFRTNNAVRRLRSKSPREDGACVRCGYQGHHGAQCFRFSQPTNTYCPICLSKGFKLLHDPFVCNRTSRSSYRTPTPETRNERIKYLKEVNESKNEKAAQNK